ncbi:Hypothetical protein NTJ_11919 [Nesidiocoris tenuis]|uniref:Uncharacterized protein n=1 Tax=Nesidiocoris tenuis TaxID=355587 RepID=A0ABN7B3X1_9HEMI|nr:Hypothetical protein NTJ_11919 [Nesidiocoris tenuis]
MTDDRKNDSSPIPSVVDVSSVFCRSLHLDTSEGHPPPACFYIGITFSFMAKFTVHLWDMGQVCGTCAAGKIPRP